MADLLDTLLGRLVAIAVFIGVVASVTVMVVVARHTRRIAEVTEREVKEAIQGNGANERSEERRD